MDAKHRFRSLVVRVVFLVLLGWAVALVRAVRRKRAWDDWTDTDREWKPALLPVDDESDEQAARRPFRAHKLATSTGLVVVFFAAATFTAGAGDMVAKALDPARCAALMQVTGEDDYVCAEMMQEEAAPEATPLVEPVVEAAVPEAPAAAPESPEAPASPEAAEVPAELAGELAAAEAGAALVDSAPAADPASPDPSAASEPVSSSDAAAAPPAADPESYVLAPEAPAVAATSKTTTRHWVVRRAKESKVSAPVVEDEGGSPTVWLNRALPDPTPPAKRLSPAFAKNLQHISAVNGVSWSLVLGVLRAEGARDRVPATVRELNALARGLSQRGAADSEWNAALALSGRTGFADRAVALARYNRVVGLRSLVNGLEAEKETLAERVLLDRRVSLYGAGREDVRAGRIDVRVVVLISYLAESYGEVTVSSLFSGHRKYARPGVVSAHIYGHAVDIASVGKLPIAGHQQPGSVTEKAVRSILMLPVELQPRQVISLLGLGGPSFPMSDHDDHIHVGY
jgi:hypothetical protein